MRSLNVHWDEAPGDSAGRYDHVATMAQLACKEKELRAAFEVSLDHVPSEVEKRALRAERPGCVISWRIC